MKILGLVGSPRQGGNTHIIIDKVLEGAQDKGFQTEKIWVNELDFTYCAGCMDCRKTAKCETEDDVQKLVAKIDEADAVAVGAPVYGNHLPGHFKMLFDRLTGIMHNIEIKGPEKMEVTSRLSSKKRNILVIAVAGAHRLESCESTLKYLARVFSAEANGGFVEQMPVTGLIQRGQIAYSDHELRELVMKYRSPEPEVAIKKMKNLYNQYLEQAYNWGVKMASE